MPCHPERRRHAGDGVWHEEDQQGKVSYLRSRLVPPVPCSVRSCTRSDTAGTVLVHSGHSGTGPVRLRSVLPRRRSVPSESAHGVLQQHAAPARAGRAAALALMRQVLFQFRFVENDVSTVLCASNAAGTCGPGRIIVDRVRLDIRTLDTLSGPDIGARISVSRPVL